MWREKNNIRKLMSSHLRGSGIYVWCLSHVAMIRLSLCILVK